MNRREAVQYISILLGGTIVGTNAFISGCKSETGKEQGFTQEDIAYLDEIAETILPATKTPGAKAAKVGQFMTVMVNDCYEEDEQKTFREGMDKINDLSKEQYGKNFMEINTQQRHDLLVKLDAEQNEYSKKRKPNEPPHYFRLMKELTLNGYFTSEIGCTQARRYVETPGRYEGCVPYTKGEKSWA
jgi:hypothetical protein